MIPTDRFAILLAASGLMIGLSGRVALLMPAGIALIILACILCAMDALALIRVGKPEVTRIIDDIISLGAQNSVKLQISNRARRHLHGTIRDEYPEDFIAAGNELPFDIAARSEVELTYHVRPPHRGDFEFGDVFLRMRGPTGLLVRQVRCDMRQAVKVYPNLLDLKHYEIGIRHRVMQPGSRVVRTYGRGTDFESLREYVPDDEFRAIDWKASARVSKLISRQYQEEKSQNVMILLDCGRAMGPSINGLSRLDWSINAGMMLAHVAAIRGDRVGLMAFSEQALAFTAPKPGKGQTLNLLRLTYNLSSAAGDSNYYHAFPLFARKWTRRSLIVIFTELADPDASKPLISQVAGLAGKHLCVVIAMSDPALAAAAGDEPQTPQDAYRSAAARQVIRTRKRTAAELISVGAIVLDVLPGDFTPALIDEYLRIKAAGRL
jgi:uncharacterized protein (DUF58 family)